MSWNCLVVLCSDVMFSWNVSVIVYNMRNGVIVPRNCRNVCLGALSGYEYVMMSRLDNAWITTNYSYIRNGYDCVKMHGHDISSTTLEYFIETFYCVMMVHQIH